MKELPTAYLHIHAHVADQHCPLKLTILFLHDITIVVGMSIVHVYQGVLVGVSVGMLVGSTLHFASYFELLYIKYARDLPHTLLLLYAS